MNNNKKGLLGLGVITAIASSLCCIAPILTLIIGSSSVVSNFSWIEPARPYLITLTILILGFVWYQKLKPIKQDNCGCDKANKKTSFMQSTLFLVMVTGFTIIMTLFPYYSNYFFTKINEPKIIISEENKVELEVKVSGMSCESCQNHINEALLQMEGISKVNTSYANGHTQVVYDKSKTTYNEIIKAINNTGYKAIE